MLSVNKKHSLWLFLPQRSLLKHTSRRSRTRIPQPSPAATSTPSRPAVKGLCCVGFFCFVWGDNRSVADRNKMSDTVDGISQHSDEERVSLSSNGKTPTKTLGKIGSSLRSSIRRVAERNPLSPGGKGSKVTPPSPSEYPPREF